MHAHVHFDTLALRTALLPAPLGGTCAWTCTHVYALVTEVSHIPVGGTCAWTCTRIRALMRQIGHEECGYALAFGRGGAAVLHAVRWTRTLDRA